MRTSPVHTYLSDIPLADLPFAYFDTSIRMKWREWCWLTPVRKTSGNTPSVVGHTTHLRACSLSHALRVLPEVCVCSLLWTNRRFSRQSNYKKPQPKYGRCYAPGWRARHS